ncbi:uncharacterized protein [Antedon mediterranea]|uniref:uncharacterized protein n=1 Tax=Antedon mediterranea TaxID=105859 RepID=UPI003AF8A414
MTVHLFGSTSSPSCANKALQQTAADCSISEIQENTKKTLLRNFYVDDLLKSVENPETGVELIKQLRILCQDGGFRLTKWTSNSKKVINTIPESERSKELQSIKST